MPPNQRIEVACKARGRKGQASGFLPIQRLEASAKHRGPRNPRNAFLPAKGFANIELCQRMVLLAKGRRGFGLRPRKEQGGGGVACLSRTRSMNQSGCKAKAAKASKGNVRGQRPPLNRHPSSCMEPERLQNVDVKNPLVKRPATMGLQRASFG